MEDITLIILGKFLADSDLVFSHLDDKLKGGKYTVLQIVERYADKVRWSPKFGQVVESWFCP